MNDFVNDVSKLWESLAPQNELVITQERVTNLFKRVNMCKAAGPDSMCGRSRRH